MRSPPPSKIHRAPAPPRRGSLPAKPNVELRLAIGKDGLGLELARPARIACVEVTDLAATLPTARFPIDVSGGVARFRHRRGLLQALALEAPSRGVERWAAPRLRGLVSAEAPEVWISARGDGATFALSANERALEEKGTPRILAFDLFILADGDDLLFVVAGARGAGLAAPATALATAAVETLLEGTGAVREGAQLRIARASERIGRALLPDAGARAPSAEGMRWTAIAASGDSWLLRASTHGAAAQPSDDALRGRESAALTRDADDARFAGDLVRARALDLTSLERAPRHPDIARRIAEIDQLAGDRAEAALATLALAGRNVSGSPEPSGVLAAALLAETGDQYAAVAAFARVGEAEVVPALGAYAFERAAELSADPYEALALLDRGLARAPRTMRLRWSRMRARLAVGRLEDALADVEHLEAQATTAEKHFVWRRAGEAWSRAGHRAEAATLFERALRYAPDAPEALAGIGMALVAEGRAARGVVLLTRAIELAEKAGVSAHATSIELARALADALEDLPAAIARVQTVPNDAAEAREARGLEGRWRARLGDLAGATLAFARLRDLASTGAGRPGTSALDFLIEAADFEREERADLFGAQRHLAAALQLAPHDARALRMYREVGAEIARGAKGEERAPLPMAGNEDADEFGEEEPETHVGKRSSPTRLDIAFAKDESPIADGGDGALSDEAEARASARVDDLIRVLHIDPTRDEIVDELAALLQSLGRSHELLALLIARLEDATPERRAALAAPTRAVLERLEKSARDEGRESEAQLFRDAIAMLRL